MPVHPLFSPLLEQPRRTGLSLAEADCGIVASGEGRGPVTSLLVSVRSVADARAALAGGASVIDVKEPGLGPLGAPEVEAVRRIVEAIDGRAAVTVAAGELAEGPASAVALARVPGVAMVKVGLSGLADPQPRGLLLRGLRERMPPDVGLTPCAYADYHAAGGPAPEALIEEAADGVGRWVLVDTWRKEGAGLFGSLDPRRVAGLVERGRASGVAVALAGQLRGESLLAAARLGAPLIGVRGAVCQGGRTGTVCSRLVADAVRLVAQGASEDDA
jgi:hypothetical protein